MSPARQKNVDMRVIAIDSPPVLSPKVQPRRSTRSDKGKQRARFVSRGNVIELSDSDEDYPVLVPQPHLAVDAPMAGPSGSDKVALPLFLPDPDEGAAGLELANRQMRRNTDGAVIVHDMAMQFLAAPPQQPHEPEPVAAQQPQPPLSSAVSDSMDVDRPNIDDSVRLDAFVAQVLEIIPDVQPEHARALLQQYLPTYGEQVVERVLHILFDSPNYPKTDLKGKGKRKREDEDDDTAMQAKSVKVDYASTDRRVEGGTAYTVQALEQLYGDFPTIPVTHVREVFRRHNQLYAPTCFFLRVEAKQPKLPYKPKQTGNRRAAKGKGKHSEELEKEIVWVQLQLENDKVGISNAQAPAAEAEDGGIECGCCFSNYAFNKMIQCPDAHLFCQECMTSYAETLLGSHDANIVCMDQSGCKLAFPESELERFLSPKLLSLYERIKQRKEIEAAGLDGLEECPHCEYKVVIENDQEKLFRCQNEDCMAITCRQCKKPDHLPKNCKEVEDDRKLDARHAIEEAMTAALMRNCPQCQKAFVKEMGCNKMICPNCRTMSCYTCRKVISGYEHFDRGPPYQTPKDPTKCALWDSSVEKRHSDEVTAAAKKAMDEYKRAHPETNENDIQVDLPPAPVPGPSNLVGALALDLPPGLPGFGEPFLNVRRDFANHLMPAAIRAPPPPRHAHHINGIIHQDNAQLLREVRLAVLQDEPQPVAQRRVEERALREQRKAALRDRQAVLRAQQAALAEQRRLAARQRAEERALLRVQAHAARALPQAAGDPQAVLHPRARGRARHAAAMLQPLQHVPPPPIIHAPHAQVPVAPPPAVPARQLRSRAGRR